MELISPRVVRRLKRLTARRPALGLRVTAALGAGLGMNWAPSADELGALLGPMPRAAMARLRRQIAARELLNHVINSVTSRYGMDVLRDQVDVLGGERLLELRREKRPLVVVFWHIGCFRAVPAALAQLGLPTLVLAKKPPRRAGLNLSFRRLEGRLEGARFLKVALAQLADTGIVAMSLDSRPHDAFAGVGFLGCKAWVARGPLLLARRGGALIVPATSRWIPTSGRAEVTFHAPVEAAWSDGAHERAAGELAARAVRPFEDHVRAHPEDLRLCLVQSLLRDGPVDSGANPWMLLASPSHERRAASDAATRVAATGPG